MQHETIRLVDEQRDHTSADRTAATALLGKAALKVHPELTPQNVYNLAAEEAGETRSLLFHPVPTREQEGMMFSHLPDLVNGQRPRTAVPVRALLNDSEFLKSIAYGSDSDRQRWLYVLAVSDNVREVIVACNQRLVMKFASRMWVWLLPYEDRYAAGNAGLLEAIDRFDSTMGTKFSTTTVRHIYRGIQRMVQDRYHITQWTTKQVPILRYFLYGYQEVFGELPGRDALKLHLLASADNQEGRPRLTPLMIDRLVDVYLASPLYQGRANDRSLNEPIFDDSSVELGTRLTRTESAESSAGSSALHATLQQALNSLSPLQRQLIYIYFGETAHGEQTAKEPLDLDQEATESELRQALVALRQNPALQAWAATKGFASVAPLTTASQYEKQDSAKGRTPEARIEEVREAPTAEIDAALAAETTTKGKIRILALSGFNTNDILTKLAISRSGRDTYLRELADEGIARPKTARQMAEEKRIERVRELREQGLSKRQIGQAMKLGRNVVLRLSNAAGMKDHLGPNELLRLRQEMMARDPDNVLRLRAWLADHPWVKRPAVNNLAIYNN